MLRDAHPAYHQNYERIGIEVIQGCVKWKRSGRMMCSGVMINLRVWGIAFEELGYERVWMHYTWTLWTEKDKNDCLNHLRMVLKQGDVGLQEVEILNQWIEMISGFETFHESDNDCCGLQKLGLNYDHCGDGDAQHDPGGS
jgi:hypothetical protein